MKSRMQLNANPIEGSDTEPKQFGQQFYRDLLG